MGRGRWLLDRWLETRFFILVGTILGLTVAIYLVVVKYGAVDPPPRRSAHKHDPGRAASRPGERTDAEGTTVTSSAVALASSSPPGR